MDRETIPVDLPSGEVCELIAEWKGKEFRQFSKLYDGSGDVKWAEMAIEILPMLVHSVGKDKAEYTDDWFDNLPMEDVKVLMQESSKAFLEFSKAV